MPGAKDVGIEIHSLSKGFDMIGWRIGWFCGHERLVQALADVKDNSDSGQFIAIQKAAATALDDPAIPVRTKTTYERRLRKLVAMLGRCGFTCEMPGGTYFLYTPSPKGTAAGLRFACRLAFHHFPHPDTAVREPACSRCRRSHSWRRASPTARPTSRSGRPSSWRVASAEPRRTATRATNLIGRCEAPHGAGFPLTPAAPILSAWTRW